MTGLQSPLVLRDLAPYTDYTVRLSASTSDGAGPAAEVGGTTLAAVPSIARNVSVSQDSGAAANVIEVATKPVSAAMAGGPNVSYVFACTVATLETQVASPVPFAELRVEAVGAPAVCRVAVANALGRGPFGPAAQLNLPVAAPSIAVSGVMVEAAPTAATVSWQPLSDARSNGPVRFYNVTLQRVSDGDTFVRSVASSPTVTVFESLLPVGRAVARLCGYEDSYSARALFFCSADCPFSSAHLVRCHGGCLYGCLWTAVVAGGLFH